MRFPVSYVKPKLAFKNKVLYKMAKYSNNPSIHNMFPYVQKEPEIPGVKEDEILLGYASDSFDPQDGIVTIPFRRDRSFVGIVMAARGSGKSVLATNIALDNLLARFDVPCFFIDPSWEFSTRKYPQLNTDLVDKLAKLGLSPRGYPTKVFTPKMVSSFGNQGTEYIIDLVDFKRIGQVDAPTMLQSLIEFFEVDGASQRAAKRMFYPLVADLAKCPDTIFQFKREVNDSINSKRMSTVTGKPTGKKVSTVLLDIIDSFTMSHRMGLSNVNDSVDFAKELAENRFVILQGSVGGASERFLSTYIKLAILTLVYDRARQIRQRSGQLKTGALVVIDEADKFAPEKTMIPSRTPIVELATRQRKLNMSILAITQKPQLLDQALVGESDFILCSKIATEEERAILRNRGISKFDVNSVLANLRQKVELPSGHTVSEWAYIDRNNQLKTFFPCPPRSAMFEEQAG